MWFIDAALTRAHCLRTIPRWTPFGGEGIGVQSVGRTELVWRVFISPKAILHGMWGLPDCFLIRRPHTWSARIFLKTRLLSPLPPTSRYTTSYSLLYNYFLWNLQSAVETRSSVSSYLRNQLTWRCEEWRCRGCVYAKLYLILRIDILWCCRTMTTDFASWCSTFEKGYSYFYGLYFLSLFPLHMGLLSNYYFLKHKRITGCWWLLRCVLSLQIVKH